MPQTHTAVSQDAVSWLPASRTTRFFSPLSQEARCSRSPRTSRFRSSSPLFPSPFSQWPFCCWVCSSIRRWPSQPWLRISLKVPRDCPFSPPRGPAGSLHLMGPSGGFLLSYPFAAVLVSKLYRSLRPSSFTFAALSAAAGSVVYFTGGASWLAVITHQPMSIALKMAVWPFLAGDALKVVLAAAIVTGFSRLHSRQNAEAAH